MTYPKEYSSKKYLVHLYLHNLATVKTRQNINKIARQYVK